MYIVYLDFNKAFDTVSNNILIGKHRTCGLDKWALRWIKNWMNDRSQRAVISRAESSSRPAVSGAPQRLLHLYEVNTFCFYLKYIDQYK